MAINAWVTATLDPSAGNKADRANHLNTVTVATADGGNATLAIDTAVVTRMTLLDSLLATMRAVYAGRLPP